MEQTSAVLSKIKYRLISTSKAVLEIPTEYIEEEIP